MAAATGAEEAGVTAEGGDESQVEVQKGGFGCCATPQAKLHATRAKRAALDEKLRAAAHAASAEENDHGFNYFVCFNSHRACNLAKQVRARASPVRANPARANPNPNPIFNPN